MPLHSSKVVSITPLSIYKYIEPSAHENSDAFETPRHGAGRPAADAYKCTDSAEEFRMTSTRIPFSASYDTSLLQETQAISILPGTPQRDHLELSLMINTSALATM